MNNLYKFTAHNSQAIYGWGRDEQADAYCGHLNRDREINCYEWEKVIDRDEIDRMDDNGDGVDLCDELMAIADAQ